jgi:hypothetical protein
MRFATPVGLDSVVQVLLDRDADPDACDSNPLKRCPLHHAVICTHSHHHHHCHAKTHLHLTAVVKDAPPLLPPPPYILLFPFPQVGIEPL